MMERQGIDGALKASDQLGAKGQCDEGNGRGSDVAGDCVLVETFELYLDPIKAVSPTVSGSNPRLRFAQPQTFVLKKARG